jgi:hypothetical protein
VFVPEHTSFSMAFFSVFVPEHTSFSYWIEFCYGVYNQYELFIYLNLIIKRENYLLRGTLSGGPVPN